MTPPGGAAPLIGELDPLPLSGETLRFDLSAYLSTVTRQMVQARVRRTAQAFGVSDDLVAANLSADGGELRVDAAALMAANAAVTARLEAGAAGAIEQMRAMRAAQSSLGSAAAAFARPAGRGQRPSRATLRAYLQASARDQALGSLKFCLPADIRPRVARLLGGPDLVEPLLAPDAASLWSDLALRELALADARLRQATDVYRARLEVFRRAHGYLYAEDVDFREHEAAAALDQRFADLGAELAPARRRLAAARRADRARKLVARQVFAERLALPGLGHDCARLVSHILLTRALAAHEGQNRRGKMRLLRDLRDLGETAGLDLERAGLRDFMHACATGEL